MTNNTIPNVPRELLELLERVKSLCEYWFVRGQQQHLSESEHKTWHALGFGSSAFTELRTLLSAPSPAGVDGLNTDRNAAFKACPESGCDWGSFYLGWKARGEVEQAIIDGLRGENEALNAQVKALQSDANSWQSGYDEGRRMGGKHCALTIDQQAQRIGELEELLREAMESMWVVERDLALLARIDAALSEIAKCH